ncbi:MAG: class I SAM-dependent methyltransferase [Deltaproteobacteria bacterium]|nr:class I SAM-dependent methyltransferase [Deltaproteobacteria bacterium]
MGYVQEKYTNEYFLGSIDKETGKSYGVNGHESFKLGRIHAKYLKFLLTLKLKNKVILDIGCGRGEVIAYCARKGIKRVVGIDFSQDAIDIALESNRGNPKIELIQMEAKDIEFRNIFDIVFLLDVIEHIPNEEMQLVYPKIYTALKDSGMLILETPFFKSSEDKDDSDFISVTKGMHCNKQTKEKLFNDLIKHKFHKYTLYIWSKSHKFSFSIFLYILTQKLFHFINNFPNFIYWYVIPFLLLLPKRIRHPKAAFSELFKKLFQR